MADEIPPLLARYPDEPFYPEPARGEVTYLPVRSEGRFPTMEELAAEGAPPAIDPETGEYYTPAQLASIAEPTAITMDPQEMQRQLTLRRLEESRQGIRTASPFALPTQEPGAEGPPAALAGQELSPYAQQVPQTLDMRAMFAGMSPPGIDLSGARQAISQLRGYEGRIAKAGEETEKLLGEKAEILERQSNAEQRLISQQEKIRADALKQQDEADRLRVQAREAANTDIRQKLNGLQDLQNNLAAAKIDPDRYWKEKDTGQRIAIAIGIALGTIGSILSKSPNYALDIIEKAIDRDLDAQKADIQRLGMQVNLQQNLIAQTRAITQDEEAEYKAAKSMLLDRVASQYELAGLRYKDETTKSRLGLIVNDVSVLAQKFRGETAMHLADSAARRYNAEFQMAGAESAAASQKWMASMKLLQPAGAGLNPGLKPYGAGPDKREEKEANRSYQNYLDIDSKFEQLIEIARMPAYERYTPTNIARARSIAATMTSKTGKEFGLGKLSEADFALLAQVVANPTKASFEGWFTRIPLQTLLTSRKEITASVRNSLRGMRVDFAAEPVMEDPAKEED